MTPARQRSLLAVTLTAAALLGVNLARCSDEPSPSATHAKHIKPVNLRCEYLTDPLSIETTSPRLSWIIVSPQREMRQTAYQVLTASSLDSLAKDQGDLWDSGKVVSDQSIQVEYAGKPLTSRMRCYWKVRIWDTQGNPTVWSEPAAWAMGLLKPDEWKANWIAASDAATQDALLLRKAATLPSNVRSAIVRICGLGQYELFLNGKKVGDRVIEPAWTNYRKSCQYSTYDITEMLGPGVNVFAVMLGNGMYNVGSGRYTKFTGSFGPLKLILQADMVLADGSSAELLTEGTWKAATGPITFTSIYGGEDCDARREPDGWMQPGYDDSLWKPAVPTEGPGGRLIPQLSPPVNVVQTLTPVAVSEPQPGTLIYDLGQNISGWPKITVEGPAGATVKIVPEEFLDSRGMVSQRFGPTSYSYTLKGVGKETWHPQFSYYGFRYLQVEGATHSMPAPEGKPLLVAIEGNWLYGSAAPAGAFSCSNRLLNQIHRLVDAAMRSNMQSIFTDCPHREKLGWLSVASSMAFSRMYNYAVPTLYTKIVDDMREAQTDDGLIPGIVPEYTIFEGAFRDSPTWGSDCILVPWFLYQHYGDRRVMQSHYATMNRYMDYLASKSQGNLLSHGLADWADTGPHYPYSHTPVPLVETAQYYCDAETMQQIATRLGKADDAARFAELAAKIKQAFNEEFFHPDSNSYGDNTQTANAMPLAFAMVGAGRERSVLENLLGDIRDRGNEITCGCTGFRWLLRVLADRGHSELIYDVFNNMDRPGYGYQIKQGATAMTEAWDAKKDVSWNHDMLGQIEEWFYHDLAGIQIDLSRSGSDRLKIKPAVIGDLTWVKSHHDSVFGRIESNWTRTGNTLTMDVSIPANTTALVYVPTSDPANVREGENPVAEAEGVKQLRQEAGAVVLEVGSGDYRFVAQVQETDDRLIPKPP